MCGARLRMRIPDDPNDHKVLSVARLGMYRRLPCRNIRFPRVGGKHKARILVLLSYYNKRHGENGFGKRIFSKTVRGRK